MATPTLRQWIRPQHSFSPHARTTPQWPDSVVVNRLIEAAIGFLYSFLVYGPARLDPTNLFWIGGNTATYYIGWELFRQAPRLHWPLAFTDRLGYPLSDSIVFMNLNPL